MITISDALIVTGAATSLVGCWLHSLEAGLIGSGLVLCLVGRVVYGINGKGRKQ